MPNPTQQLADVLREVTVSVERAIADGHRSREVDADDLVEILLSIADRLDPPLRETNRVAFPCENCGEVDADLLVWQDDEFVRCETCGTIYSPGI